MAFAAVVAVARPILAKVGPQLMQYAATELGSAAIDRGARKLRGGGTETTDFTPYKRPMVSI